jgi:MFS family permease
MKSIAPALRHRNFRLYFTGQIVSLIGTWIQQVAMSWLAYRLTDSVWVLGIIGFASQFPILIFAPLGGIFSDRFNRHRLILLTQTLSMALALLLAALTLAKLVQVWHLVTLAALLGLINAIDGPTRQSFTVLLVDKREDLANAIAINSFTFNSARLIGPAIAGLLIGWLGEGACFLFNSLSYIAVLVALSKIKVHDPPRHSAPIMQGLQEGFRYVASSTPIRSLLLIVAAMSLCVAPFVILLPYYAKEVFHGDARLLGLLTGCSGIGALSGALFLASRRQVAILGRYVLFASCIGTLALMAFSFSRSLWLTLPLVVLLGFGLIVTAASSNTLIQTLVPDHLRGRVMSLYTMAFLGMAPLGSLISGRIAEHVGVPPTLFGAGVLALTCIAGLRGGLVGMDEHVEQARATPLPQTSAPTA